MTRPIARQLITPGIAMTSTFTAALNPELSTNGVIHLSEVAVERPDFLDWLTELDIGEDSPRGSQVRTDRDPPDEAFELPLPIVLKACGSLQCAGFPHY